MGPLCATMPPMRGSMLSWGYRRLGRHYPTAFLALELPAGLLITAGTVLLLSFFYDGSASEFGLILAVSLGLTAIALAFGFIRIRPMMAPLRAWLERLPRPRLDRAGLGQRRLAAGQPRPARDDAARRWR